MAAKLKIPTSPKKEMKPKKVPPRAQSTMDLMERLEERNKKKVTH